MSNNSFKAADLSNLNAGNIKSGVNVAGVSGDYPSSSYRLSGSDTTTDLTGFGPSTSAGTYEFFDSSGSRYIGIVADSGTLTPGSSQQIVSAANTFYRELTVAGDSDLIAVNIKDQIEIFGITGSLSGTPANCASDGSINCIVDGISYKAAALSGAAGKILFGESLAGVSGNIVLPAVGKVLSGTSYGVGGNGRSGTLVLPAASEVLSGSGTFGDPGSPLTPSYAPDFPSVANVRSGDTVNGAAGTLLDCAAGNSVGCVTISTYRSMDLSSAGVMTDLTQANFNTSIASASNVEFWDSTGTRHQITGDSDLVAGNILSGVQIHGVSGSVVAESHINCASDGSQNCLVDGVNYKAAALSGAADKILFGESLAGVSGNIVLPAVGKVLSGTSYGVGGNGRSGTLVLPAASEVLSGSGTFGDPGSPLTPSYAPDFPSVANVRSGDTVNGAAGTLLDCAAGNSVGCVTTADYRSMNLSSASAMTDLTFLNFNTSLASASSFEFWDSTGARHEITGDSDLVAANIITGAQIHGVNGSATAESHISCVSNGSQNCVATASYYAAQACAANGADDCYLNPAAAFDAADLSNLSAAHIKRGVTIAGTTGNFPSASSPLPRFSDSGATSNVSGTDAADLDSATFLAKMKSATAFEYWDSSGIRYTDAGDADIVSANIKSAVSIFGTTGSLGTAPSSPTGLSASPASTTQLNLTWDNGSASGYLLVARAGSAVSFTPSDGTTYSEGVQGFDTIIYVGSSTSDTHTGLTPSSTYHYALFAYNASNVYSSPITISKQVVNTCGGAGDGCYDDSAAINEGFAVTPLGKQLEYVYANGSSGFRVWKEVGANRLLRANGRDEWAKALNADGKGLSASDFNDANIATASTRIAGRVCPPNVYIDDSNKFTTTNCLYYSPAYAANSLDNENWGFAAEKWYYANDSTCSSRGMRLPALFEASVSQSGVYLPSTDGSPTFAQAAGVPSTGSYTWTATTSNYEENNFFAWNNVGFTEDYGSTPLSMRCVLP